MMSIDHELFPTKKDEGGGGGRNYPFGDARGGGSTCERLLGSYFYLFFNDMGSRVSLPIQ